MISILFSLKKNTIDGATWCGINIFFLYNYAKDIRLISIRLWCCLPIIVALSRAGYPGLCPPSPPERITSVDCHSPQDLKDRQFIDIEHRNFQFKLLGFIMKKFLEKSYAKIIFLPLHKRFMKSNTSLIKQNIIFYKKVFSFVRLFFVYKRSIYS